MNKPTSGRPFILVLAGVNGAGKSSIGGHLLGHHDLSWYNPDAYSRELVTILGLSAEQANSQAWQHGRDLLQAAIQQATNFAFETTLGANTIPRLLIEAAQSHDVVMLFCGLATPEQHLARVQSRVAHGGHDIPTQKITQKIQERWLSSRANLIKLIPYLSHLQVFDNSAEAAAGEEIPVPILVLEMQQGRIIFPDINDSSALGKTPDWAKAIVQAAIELVD